MEENINYNNTTAVVHIFKNTFGNINSVLALSYWVFHSTAWLTDNRKLVLLHHLPWCSNNGSYSYECQDGAQFFSIYLAHWVLPIVISLKISMVIRCFWGGQPDFQPRLLPEHTPAVCPSHQWLMRLVYILCIVLCLFIIFHKVNLTPFVLGI